MAQHGPNRRDFLKGASMAAGGAAMGAYPPEIFAAQVAVLQIDFVASGIAVGAAAAAANNVAPAIEASNEISQGAALPGQVVSAAAAAAAAAYRTWNPLRPGQP